RDPKIFPGQMGDITQMFVSGLRTVELRACGNSSRISVNWSGGDSDVEELSTSSGLQSRCGMPSRLSGRRFFARWQRLHRQLNEWTSEDMLRTHGAWKRAAGPYQKAVRQFVASVRNAGLGTWNRKLMQSSQGAEDDGVSICDVVLKTRASGERV
uniref:A to I editase domain-containing protein n=1 Tax=Hippocampus comes TaxID=109280 RepID=A0A3Q2Y7L3_HIPCM